MKSAALAFVTGFGTNLLARWGRTTLSMCVYLLDDLLADANLFDQDLPLEYNTWLLFRQAVDLILVKLVVTNPS